MLFAKIDLFLSVGRRRAPVFQEVRETFSRALANQSGPEALFGPATLGCTSARSKSISNAVINFAFSRHAKHVLGAEIIFETKAYLLAASRSPQIIH